MAAAVVIVDTDRMNIAGHVWLRDLRERWCRHGLLGGCARIAAKIYRKVRRIWRRLFRHKNHVYELSKALSDTVCRSDVSIKSFEAKRDVPEKFLDMLLERQGQKGFAVMQREFDHGGRVWTAWVDGCPVAWLWTRLGQHLPRWFIPLRDKSVVIYGMVTLPAWRGRGIAPYVMRTAIESLWDEDGMVYIDCAVWNRPSMRAIEKLGFNRIGTMTPLPEESAMVRTQSSDFGDPGGCG